MSLLSLDALSKRFGALAATDGVSLSVAPGEVHALIGPNGAGKTTLIAQIDGALSPDSGTISLDGRAITHLPPHARAHLGLSRTFQITAVFAPLSALENVRLAAQALRGGIGLRAGSDFTADAHAALDAVGLAARAATQAGALAHGEQRALELAMALVQRPRLLLLDEPMAGAGHDESARLIALLQSLRGQVAMLLVEHDMGAVFALADRVSVLVAGRIIASGPPAAIRDDAAVRAAYLGEAS